jgi:hypothetical protein
MSHDAYHVPESIGGIVYYHIPHHYRIVESVVLQKIMFDILWNERNMSNTLCFVFITNNQVIRVQSSTNVTNQRAPEEIVIGAGPQTSV